jgi:hypothetical protein
MHAGPSSCQDGGVHQADPNPSVPPDDTPLWRYLDFARFMALLDSGSLWFARLIRGVVIAPRASPWLSGLVSSMSGCRRGNRQPSVPLSGSAPRAC